MDRCIKGILKMAIRNFGKEAFRCDLGRSPKDEACKKGVENPINRGNCNAQMSRNGVEFQHFVAVC